MSVMIEEDVVIEHLDGWVSIRLNRPAKLNAITVAMHDAIYEVVTELAETSAPPVLVMSGSGNTFSAGDDLKTTSNQVPEQWAHRQVGSAPILLQAGTRAIREYPGPTLALMKGYTIGAGWDYATSCDVRVATATCKIGDVRVRRALWAAEGWTHKAPRLMSLSAAYRVGPTGDIVSAAEAARLGLLHRIVADDADLETARDEVLGRFALRDPRAYARAKRRISESFDRSLSTHLNAIEW